MTILASVAFALCVLDLAAVIVVCSRPPVAPTPLPRPVPMPDRYPGARHRNTNDERTVRLPKLDVLIGGPAR